MNRPGWSACAANELGPHFFANELGPWPGAWIVHDGGRRGEGLEAGRGRREEKDCQEDPCREHDIPLLLASRARSVQYETGCPDRQIGESALQDWSLPSPKSAWLVKAGASKIPNCSRLPRSPEHRAAARRRTSLSLWTLKVHARARWITRSDVLVSERACLPTKCMPAYEDLPFYFCISVRALEFGPVH